MSSQSSELAGALTLPTRAAAYALPPKPKPVEQVIAVEQNQTNASLSPSTQELDQHNIDEEHVPSTSQDAHGVVTTSTEPRYCSVRGCTEPLPPDYFFKMCEPCRERYKVYGITKRAKWRAERVAANEELEALRVEEDKRRGEEGLPVSSISVTTHVNF